jgi:hypothetical protein
LLAAPLVDSDRFQLSVGRLLLCLKRQDRDKFDRELESARSQVKMIRYVAPMH